MAVYEKLSNTKAAKRGPGTPRGDPPSEQSSPRKGKKLRTEEATAAKSAQSDSKETMKAALSTPEGASDVAVPIPAVLEIAEPLQWVERMALTATKPLPDDLQPDDDPKREEVFIQHALLSVNLGLSLLERANVPWRRPSDYYAEMYKDDVQMGRIRESMEAAKSRIERRAHLRAMKDQKAFGKEVQAEVLRQRAQYKRDLDSKLSDWRRKHKGDREEALRGILSDDDDDNPGPSGGRGRHAGGSRGGSRRPHAPRPKSLKPGSRSKRPGKNARNRR